MDQFSWFLDIVLFFLLLNFWKTKSNESIEHFQHLNYRQHADTNPSENKRKENNFRKSNAVSFIKTLTSLFVHQHLKSHLSSSVRPIVCNSWRGMYRVQFRGQHNFGWYKCLNCLTNQLADWSFVNYLWANSFPTTLSLLAVWQLSVPGDARGKCMSHE